jgi:hypothetical protein
MNNLLNRLYDNGRDTIGILYYLDSEEKLRYTFTLEDEYREIKIPGETRIPAGKYEIILRTEGRTYNKYCDHRNQKIRELTRKYGILQYKNIPGFKYILSHIGNDEDDTDGCILTGNKAHNNSRGRGYIEDSTEAYIYYVSAVYAGMDRGERCYITIMDVDREIRRQFNLDYS